LEGSDDRAKLTDAGFEAVEVADTRPSGGGREAGEESRLPRPELPAQIDGRFMSGVSEVLAPAEASPRAAPVTVQSVGTLPTAGL